MGPLRIAVVGCGAVTELYHLPVIAPSRSAKLTALVDRHLPRAEALAAAYGARVAADDHRAIVGQADAAIVAVPNHLHAAVTLDLLDNGIHVLVEKPMALGGADCREMTERADAKGLVLAVGHTRRFGWGARFVKRAVAGGMLGHAISCDVREGVEYAWKVKSAFPFRRDTGGGVLADIGIHVIDLLLWWFGDGDVVAYQDDAMGGVEAECELGMRLGGAVTATVELSRTRTLRNTAIIACERGSLEIGMESDPVVRVQVAGEEAILSGEVSPPGSAPDRRHRDLMRRQLDDFIDAIVGKRPPFVAGADAGRAVSVVERCHAARRPMHPFWVFPHEVAAATPGPRRGQAGSAEAASRGGLAGKRVLVTGGTGFIGGRLVEKLVLEAKADVRVLVSNVFRAARIARFPVEIAEGDVLSAADVAAAVEGCDVVFHCANSTSGSDELRRRVTQEGTRNVVEASARSRVRRLVHVSTLMVYGKTPDGVLDETAPRRYMGDVYADSKIRAEELVLDAARTTGLPATIIQPTAVFGPYAPSYTVGIINKLKRGRIILIDGGAGVCNWVYVDDLVDGMLLAAVKPEAVGEAFLLSGEEAVVWRTFFGRFERMLDVSRTVAMPPGEARAYFKQTRAQRGLLRRAWRFVQEDPRARRRLERYALTAALLRLDRRRPAPETAPAPEAPPILPWQPYQIDFYATRTRVRIDKAKRLLGYAPQFDFETAMELTERWARWASLLDDAGRRRAGAVTG